MDIPDFSLHKRYFLQRQFSRKPVIEVLKESHRRPHRCSCPRFVACVEHCDSNNAQDFYTAIHIVYHQSCLKCSGGIPRANTHAGYVAKSFIATTNLVD